MLMGVVPLLMGVLTNTPSIIIATTSHTHIHNDIPHTDIPHHRSSSPRLSSLTKDLKQVARSMVDTSSVFREARLSCSIG